MNGLKRLEYRGYDSAGKYKYFLQNWIKYYLIVLKLLVMKLSTITNTILIYDDKENDI